MAKWNLASYADMNSLKDKVSEAMGQGVTDLIVSQLQYIGETCVRIARDKGRANTWGDRTGNLRSSIGYAIHVNGKPVVTGPTMIYTGTEGNGKKGGAEAKSLIKALSGSKHSGIVLYVVAGMNYAVYVEERHHKDVLASSWLEGERLAHKLLDQLFTKK